MYGEMEKVRQNDQVIDLKKREQEYEQKFKPAGMFANIWVEALHLATAGGITDEDVKLLNNTMTSIFARMEERNNQKSDFQISSQEVSSPLLQKGNWQWSKDLIYCNYFENTKINGLSPFIKLKGLGLIRSSMSVMACAKVQARLPP